MLGQLHICLRTTSLLFRDLIWSTAEVLLALCMLATSNLILQLVLWSGQRRAAWFKNLGFRIWGERERSEVAALQGRVRQCRNRGLSFRLSHEMVICFSCFFALQRRISRSWGVSEKVQ